MKFAEILVSSITINSLNQIITFFNLCRSCHIVEEVCYVADMARHLFHLGKYYWLTPTGGMNFVNNTDNGILEPTYGIINPN